MYPFLCYGYGSRKFAPPPPSLQDYPVREIPISTPLVMPFLAQPLFSTIPKGGSWPLCLRSFPHLSRIIHIVWENILEIIFFSLPLSSLKRKKFERRSFWISRYSVNSSNHERLFPCNFSGKLTTTINL